MHTVLSKLNPYEADRYGFAWEHVPQNGQAHLDFGCNDGQFLNTLATSKQIETLIGLDISRECVERANQKYPDLKVNHLTSTTPLPFEDNTFDSISAMDVLEHVYEQSELMAEFQRVLKPSGTLIITVPGKNAFSFLDRGNIQFFCPRLFRWYYLRRHSQEEYEYNYVNNPDGLVGSVSAQKGWHEHFSRNKLNKLTSRAGLNIIDFDGVGLFNRLIDIVDFVLRRPLFLRKSVEWLKHKDRHCFESYNMFCLSTKNATA